VKPPWYQRVLKIVKYVIGGFVALGALLDSVANAVSLMTPIVASIGTACIVLVWFLARIILPSYPLLWVFGNQRMQVRKPGIQPTAFALGMVLLLWVPSLMEYVRPTKELPDVALRFVSPKAPALVLVNQSAVIARDIQWQVLLWNMDLPDRDNPLPIPIMEFPWLRPHEQGGPLNLFGSPSVAPLLKPGNQLFGSAAVICADCARGRTYIVRIVWDEGGWFTEVEHIKSGTPFKPLHSNFSKEGRIAHFKALEMMDLPQSRTPLQ
jgi:hypothetical protein